MKNLVYNSLMAVFILVFTGSGLLIAYKLIARGKAESQMEELKAVFTASDSQEVDESQIFAGVLQNNPSVGGKLSEQKAAREKRLQGYGELHKRNNDMTGWITIPGTQVDYPVMQSIHHPDFYLKHNFEKKKSSYGTPYIAEACDLGSGEDNIVIYGHHMKNGTMFGDLMKYSDKSYYEAHPLIWFDTLDRVGAYEIIAVAKASATDSKDENIFHLAAEHTKRSEFLQEVLKRVYYDTGKIGGETEDEKPLLVLITCEYTQKEGRLLVIARENRIPEDEK